MLKQNDVCIGVSGWGVLTNGSLSLGKTNTIVSQVKLSIIWANEYISQDPQGANRDVNTKEATETLSLAHDRHLCKKKF